MLLLKVFDHDMALSFYMLDDPGGKLISERQTAYVLALEFDMLRKVLIPIMEKWVQTGK